MLSKKLLNKRFSELKKDDDTWTKARLAKKIQITPMSVYNKFENPDTITYRDFKKMVKAGFLKSFVIEL
jgi:hypothetical protein